MNTGDRTHGEKRSVSAGVAVAGGVVLLAVVGCLAYMNFVPRVALQKAAHKSETTLWIEQKAAQSGGELAKLSPEDQQKLQRVSHGKGEMMLKMLAPKK